MLSFSKVFLEQRKLIPTLLLQKNNYEYLVSQLQNFENQNGSLNEGIYNTQRPIVKEFSFYELPTQELLTTITKICKFFKTDNVLEVGAGSALFSHMINSLNNGLSFNPSDPVSYEFHDFQGNYMPVKKLAFNDINEKDPIFISWLYDLYQTDFLNMIRRNRPKFIIHVGHGPGGYCYNENFLPNLKQIGYNYQLFPVKMLSKLDYFKDDQIRKNKTFPYSRSCLTLLVDSNNFPTFDFKVFDDDVNFHQNHGYNINYHTQDIKIFGSYNTLSKMDFFISSISKTSPLTQSSGRFMRGNKKVEVIVEKETPNQKSNRPKNHYSTDYRVLYQNHNIEKYSTDNMFDLRYEVNKIPNINTSENDNII